MRSPTYALIWEQWRQVRTVVVLGIVLTFAASLSGYLIKWVSTDEWASFTFAMAWGSLLLVMAVLMFTHSSVRDLRMGLPARMLTLPLTARHIAATQIGFRFAVMAGTALVLGVLLTTINEKYFEIAHSLVGAIVLYAYASMLATLGRRFPVVVIAMIIITIAPVVATVYYLDNGAVNWFGFQYGVLGTFIFFCMAASFVSLARIREPARVQILFDTASPQNTEFKVLGVRASGPYWFEWRTVGWIVPAVTLFSGIFFALPLFGMDFDEMDLEDTFQSYFATSLVSSFQVGMMLIGIFTARVSRVLWTKPVTVQDVVLNRMRVIAKSNFFTQLALATIFLFAIQLNGAGVFYNVDDVWLLLMLYMGIFIASWCMVWVPYLPILYWAYFICCLAAAALTKSEPSDFWLIAVPEAVFLGLLCWVGNVCLKRQLFQRKAIFGFTCLAVFIFVVGTLQLYQLDEPNADWFNLNYISMVFIFSLMPLFCLLSQGVILDRMRHGQPLFTRPRLQ
ncbi:MAG: hypothetical protein SGI88_02640 [Candidatus Hydrogenedentes bacterium]|nr:hypothetical protein [Candidatus Hydrogenedentota bacterium]